MAPPPNVAKLWKSVESNTPTVPVPDETAPPLPSSVMLSDSSLPLLMVTAPLVAWTAPPSLKAEFRIGPVRTSRTLPLPALMAPPCRPRMSVTRQSLSVTLAVSACTAPPLVPWLLSLTKPALRMVRLPKATSPWPRTSKSRSRPRVFGPGCASRESPRMVVASLPAPTMVRESRWVAVEFKKTSKSPLRLVLSGVPVWVIW